MLLYTCNKNKNIKCRKKNCSKDYCTHTTHYRYAKKNIINYIKMILNKINGNYKY